MTEQFEQAVQKVMKEKNVTKASAQKIVGNIELKSKKARLLKIRLAGVGLPRFPSTSEARRGLVQSTKPEGLTKSTTKNRLEKEKNFINEGKPIRPTGADTKINPELKKRLAKITKGNTTFKTQTPEDIADIEDVNKNIKPLKGTTQTKKKKLPPSSVTNRYAKEHGHTIVFKGVARGVYRSASLEGQQGRYAKYWLLNAKQTNGNGWGIATHTAQQNMKKFIGRPLVVTSSKWHGASMYGESFEHPYLPTNDLKQIFAHQEKFRVGNIVDIQKDSNDDYYATIEMLPKFAGMNLPPFCSPAIYQLDARENEGNISKWEALHLAALDENPAYGARIALLRGTCIGTPDACSIQFKVAKLVGRRKPRNSDEREEQDKEEEQAVDDDRNFFVGKLKRRLGQIQRNAVIMDFTEDIGPITSKVQQKTIMDKFGAKKRRSGKYHRKDTEKANAKILEKEQDRINALSASITCPNKLRERLANIFDEAEMNEDVGSKSSIAANRAKKQSRIKFEALINERKKLRLTQLKKKQKTATINETGYQTEARINRIKAPLSKEVPFGKENRSPKKIRDDSLNKATDEGLATFGGTKLRPPKPTPKDRVRIIKAKLASLGEQNMTYQESKKVKIHKRKHPEVRKAREQPTTKKGFNNWDAALRSLGNSVDGEHAQSSFLSQKGDFIGGRGPLTHSQQLHGFGLKHDFTDQDEFITNFSAKHGLPRVQNMPINREGIKKTSIGIHSKINRTQLRSIMDIEKSGREIGFGVGPTFKNITQGGGTRDMMKALKEHKFL